MPKSIPIGYGQPTQTPIWAYRCGDGWVQVGTKTVDPIKKTVVYTARESILYNLITGQPLPKGYSILDYRKDPQGLLYKRR